MNKKFVSILGILIVLGILGFAAIQGIFSGDETLVARVNGEDITEKLLNSRVEQTISMLRAQGAGDQFNDESLLADLRKQTLDQLITETIIAQKIEEKGIVVSEAELQTEVDTLAAQLGGEEALRAQLASVGLSQAELDADIKTQLLQQKYFMENVDISGVVVTDEELDLYYTQLTAGQEGVPVFEEVQEVLRSQLIAQKESELINAHVEELKASATVEIL